MDQKIKPEKPSIKVAVPDVFKAGVHSNVVSVTSTSDNEVIFDFIFSNPQEKENEMRVGVLVSRVVLPTSVANRLLSILKKHLKKSQVE
ncbi:MAG TPA: DUF3467 domain-containing protein [Candidatus Bathyarchaeia archaeon]|nr:DUF3467 domain-containing protein [Candidatus Bathyarchaeia archaeon]